MRMKYIETRDDYVNIRILDSDWCALVKIGRDSRKFVVSYGAVSGRIRTIAHF